MLEIFIHFQVQKTSNNSSIDLTIKNIGLVHIYSESSDTISFFSFSRPFVLSFYFGYHLPLAHPRYPFPLHRPPLSKHLHNLLYSLDSVGGESALDDFRCSSIDRSYCTFNGQTHTESSVGCRCAVKRDRQMGKGGRGREIRGLDIRGEVPCCHTCFRRMCRLYIYVLALPETWRGTGREVVGLS